MGMSLDLALFSSFRWKKRPSKGTRRVRGRKRLRREGDFVAPEIPLDILIEIMTRLSVKPLMRFKCVSKSWFSLIRSRYFSNIYCLAASPTRSPRLYLSLMEHLYYDSMKVCQNLKKSALLSLSCNNNDESFDQDLTMPGMGGHNMMVLRGLILYRVCRKACIYNPTTKQSLTLPPIKSNIVAQKGNKNFYDYFLGHDPVLDQYKVVCIVSSCSKDFTRIISESWVFVLEVGGSWKIIEFNQPHAPTDIGLCIKGVIYYVAEIGMDTSGILSFDVRSEKFSLIQPPGVVSKFDDFIEYGGRPAIFKKTHLKKEGMVELWVLEDGGKWYEKSLVLQHCHMHLVDNTVDLWVHGTTQNGEVILAPSKLISPYYILCYDLQKNVLRKVEIRGIRDHKLINPYFCLLLNKNESIMHLEI